MDQFGIELGHGEIALDLSDAIGVTDEKFSPRRTRSGRVYDSKLTERIRHRRRSQQSHRSRNSSGQSGTGSVDDSSENDDCLPDLNCDRETSKVYSYLKKSPRCRLDLSDNNCQEIPISPSSAFVFENLLSPKKLQVKGINNGLICRLCWLLGFIYQLLNITPAINYPNVQFIQFCGQNTLS